MRNELLGKDVFFVNFFGEERAAKIVGVYQGDASNPRKAIVNLCVFADDADEVRDGGVTSALARNGAGQTIEMFPTTYRRSRIRYGRGVGEWHLGEDK
jgi:hypothetical protein